MSWTGWRPIRPDGFRAGAGKRPLAFAALFIFYAGNSQNPMPD